MPGPAHEHAILHRCEGRARRVIHAEVAQARQPGGIHRIKRRAAAAVGDNAEQHGQGARVIRGDDETLCICLRDFGSKDARYRRRAQRRLARVERSANDGGGYESRQ